MFIAIASQTLTGEGLASETTKVAIHDYGALQMTSLPDEKVAELRQAIHSQVSKMGIQEQIQRCLADSHDRYGTETK